jgi:hypothetical protein
MGFEFGTQNLFDKDSSNDLSIVRGADEKVPVIAALNCPGRGCVAVAAMDRLRHGRRGLSMARGREKSARFPHPPSRRAGPVAIPVSSGWSGFRVEPRNAGEPVRDQAPPPNRIEGLVGRCLRVENCQARVLPLLLLNLGGGVLGQSGMRISASFRTAVRQRPRARRHHFR